VPPAFIEAQRRQPVIGENPTALIRRVAETKQTLHIADITELSIQENDPPLAQLADLAGARTLVIVPMLKDDVLVGAFTLARQEVRPFTDKQIELVKNFAAQAVIAIENARLLNELRQRTTDLTERTIDLTESLEQQTATSQVLQVVSSSPGDLEPVFAAMLENAVRICDASFGNIFRWEDDAMHLVAMHNTPRAFAEFRRRSPLPSGPQSAVSRAIATKTAVHIADIAAEQGYVERSYPGYVAAVELGGVRTFLAVPMLKENELIGLFTVYRQEVRPFTDKQIELIKNFSTQAVIAIENTRLLSELREKTEDVVKLNQQLEQRVDDQVGEIERMSRLRRFLPPQVADLIVASGAEKQLESHRREITALFCDLRGFTGFTESADAEDVMALLRDYHAAIGETIIKYNGTLERYAGDGVMVVFNDPVPVENPALQAVLMALEVRDAIGALTATWSRLGHDIGFGIGIAHGFATLGTIGFEGRFDYAAIGTVSNVASRLCDEAKPGQILISPRVLTKVENALKVEPVGEFELKGIRRPLAAYNVVGALSET
jgi:adenylate cyclase